VSATLPMGERASLDVSVSLSASKLSMRGLSAREHGSTDGALTMLVDLRHEKQRSRPETFNLVHLSLAAALGQPLLLPSLVHCVEVPSSFACFTRAQSLT
jgi:hypothetical protein